MTFIATGRTGAGRVTRGAPGLMALCGALFLVSACDDSGGMKLFQSGNGKQAEPAGASKSVKLVERDVEAPDVFQVTDSGLWDGRPSLGGVWVAHSDVKEPERVIIRNTTDGKFVIGALFRRERANPGPRFQVSSDAAAALGMLAGAPAELNVTALRREEVAKDGPAAAPAIESSELPPAQSGEESAAAADVAAPVAPPAPVPPQASSLDKPYIQIGIFSIKSNASNTATAMRTDGMTPLVKEQSTAGKTFWRVLVGPAANSVERSALLEKIKAAGFSDAYAVRN